MTTYQWPFARRSMSEMLSAAESAVDSLRPQASTTSRSVLKGDSTSRRTWSPSVGCQGMTAISGLPTDDQHYGDPSSGKWSSTMASLPFSWRDGLGWRNLCDALLKGPLDQELDLASAALAPRPIREHREAVDSVLYARALPDLDSGGTISISWTQALS